MLVSSQTSSAVLIKSVHFVMTSRLQAKLLISAISHKRLDKSVPSAEESEEK